MITRIGPAKSIETFTTTGNGAIMDISLYPLSKFTITVTATGVVSAWVVILECSIDGSNFSQIARHTEIIGSGVSIFSGTNLTPSLYFRSRCSSLILGLGTSITATILGTQ